MDMDMARDALVQESRELLAAMENALLEIETDGVSSEAINAIFRAAHTIKGSAGLFAFDRIVSFTHIVESVLDRVRTGKVQIDDAMLSLLLNCGDYIGALVDAIQNRTEDTEPDADRRAVLEKLLGAHLEPAPAVAEPTASSLATTAPDHGPGTEHIEGSGGVDSDNWHLSLRFSPDVLRNGLDPLSFLHYLTSLGRIVYLHTVVDTLPALSQMDAETGYLGFEIDFESDADRAKIESVFDFVREDSQIRILPPHSKIDEYIALIALMPEPGRLGDILVRGGALTEVELAQALDQQHDQQIGQKPLGAMLVEQQVVPEAVVSAALNRQKQSEDKKAHEQKFIKVEVSKLDQLIDLVGELVIAGAGANLIANRKKDAQFEEAAQSISVLVEHIRDAALTLRMVPIGEVFQRFPRVVRDISRELGKEIELIVTGAETELDKSMVEKLADPLMHIVRNSMDHGIEGTEARVLAGKSPTGMLRLNAYHESGSIVIEVSDDGRGLNRERILAKAIERGLVTPEQILSDNDIFRLIFEAGFSTAEQVTNLSGRGVGMDVVKKNIESLRGEVEILSKEGQGTTTRIRLPLTLAIIDGFQVMVNDEVFVIPLDLVIECVDLAGHDARHNIVKLRGEPLPFVRLRELFELPSLEQSRESLVVVQFGQQRAGLVVDRLLGEFQAVIKPLGSLFSGIRSISGSTILGDGRVALILDVPHLVQQTTQQQSLAQSGKSAGFLAHNKTVDL
ncbi:Chemotaxis protein CheA [Andreprevotia sp. IGB-42]|uniref:chemotaxis protein CheA n=1 Tax=Andreprevotia sp. IGB-42 TaxID=2497473 RepID=UPI00135953B9|nr:chemotaxis protein CheA [Andreprevotia sp. IGB-42]KAF0813946.1 Chemotaxis protein CheA [Andreprevotia sp. IGB-42]